jgi:hypothetical protein
MLQDIRNTLSTLIPNRPEQLYRQFDRAPVSIDGERNGVAHALL